MKKIVLFLIISCLLCALVACGGDTNTSTPDEAATSSESSDVSSESNAPETSNESEAPKDETPEEYLKRKYNWDVEFDKDLNPAKTYKIVGQDAHIILYRIEDIKDAPFWSPENADMYDSQYVDSGYSTYAYDEIKGFYTNLVGDSCGNCTIFPMLTDSFYPEAISINKTFAENLSEFHSYINVSLYIASDKTFSEEELTRLKNKLKTEGYVVNLSMIAMTKDEQSSADWATILPNWDEHTPIFNGSLS